MNQFWNQYVVKEAEEVNLNKWDTSYDGELSKEQVYDELLPANLAALSEYQDVFYADNRYGLLIVLQAMDAAGKDGLIKHVFTALNPQGTQVTPFKAPSDEEADHDYLWRCNAALPRRGNIAIFNRSHYEEVLVARVHNLVEHSQIPAHLVDEHIWQCRFKEINDWEDYLTNNGIVILKFFLHVSKEEQKERLLSRIDNPDKNWKFSTSDILERNYWADYRKSYEDLLMHTSKPYAPWFIVPADRKWYTRYVVSEIVKEQFSKLDIAFPTLPEAEQKNLVTCRELLLHQD